MEVSSCSNEVPFHAFRGLSTACEEGRRAEEDEEEEEKEEEEEDPEQRRSAQWVHGELHVDNRGLFF